MSAYLKSAIDNLYGANDDFILIGLTGRTGSGCSTVAEILRLQKGELKHSLYPGLNPRNNQERKNRILNRLVEHLWVPFKLIQVRSVITLIMLEQGEAALGSYIYRKMEDSPAKRSELAVVLENSFSQMTRDRDSDFYTRTIVDISEDIKRVLGPGLFVSLYQEVGRNIRLSGNPLSDVKVDGNFFYACR